MFPSLNQFLLVLSVAGAVALALFIIHYNNVVTERDELRAQMVTANKHIDALNSNAKKKQEIHNLEREQLDEIDKYPDTDDAPMAPVLRDTIERMYSKPISQPAGGAIQRTKVARQT